MTSDDSNTHNPTHTRLAQAIRYLGGNPFWWRGQLEKIAAGLESSESNPKAATKQLVDVFNLAKEAQQLGANFPDATVRKGLNEHYELALKEVYEFAEQRGLPLARAIRSSAASDQSGQSR